MTEKLSPHWLVFDVSMRHEDSKSLGGYQQTLIHFMGLKRAKTKLNNLRCERFEKSNVELGSYLSSWRLLSWKLFTSWKFLRPKITEFCSSLEILTPCHILFHSGIQDGKSRALSNLYSLSFSSWSNRSMSVKVNHTCCVEIVYCFSL